MAHPNIHAQSSAKKFGVGTEEDAMPLLNNLMKYNRFYHHS